MSIMLVRLMWLLALLGVILAVSLFLWPSSDKTSSSRVQEVTAQSQPDASIELPNSTKLTEQADSTPEESLITFASQISDIADAYQQSAQYPVGSQPITSPQQLVVYQPFEETHTEFPFPSDIYGTVKLSLATDRFQYFIGDEPQVLIQLSGVPASASVLGTIEVVEASKPDPQAFISLDVPMAYSGLWEASTTVSKDLLSDQDLPQELQINAYVEVDNERFFSSSVFRYEQASATVIALDNPNPNGAYLDMPLTIDVETPGYYYLAAVLYDESGDIPLVQLQQEARLKSGTQQMIFKAHIKALQYHGDEGPYTLANFSLRRGADEGEQFDQAGTSEQTSFKVDGFSFDRYDDTDYVDPLAQERAQFLRQLSDIGNSN